jgi:hypothetical protein
MGLAALALSCTVAAEVDVVGPQVALIPTRFGGNVPELMHHRYNPEAVGKPPVAV